VYLPFPFVSFYFIIYYQESPADADKPACRESIPKIAPVSRENKDADKLTTLKNFILN